MARRAAICIGVDRAGSMRPLQAAAKGARDFGDWATAQGCDTTVLTDEANARVSGTDIFDAVQPLVAARTYEQLIIYFSGHGILSAPGVEYWLLSRAPENPNEAVNLFRSIEDARNCSIPHVVFISDACRSSVNGPPLSGVVGATIFPNLGYNPTRGEIDVFYATRPGDPAWELPEPQATSNYRGVFTEFLLNTVKWPEQDLVEQVQANPAPLSVVSSRKLKPLLESLVPMKAAEIDIRIRQTPEVQVGTALPKYFATIDAASIQQRMRALPGGAAHVPSLGDALNAIRETEFETTAVAPQARDVSLAAQLGLTAEVERLQTARGRARFETRTGLTLHGARPVMAEAVGWNIDPAFQEDDAWHWRFHRGVGPSQSSTVLVFEANGVVRGIVLGILEEFIASVVVDKAGRVVSVSYVPAENSWRYAQYEQRAAQIEKMKAFAAVAAREGRFEVPREEAAAFADRVRLEKGLDPALGLYAAYAYAQADRYEDVDSVFQYMCQEGPAVPVPFDVVMLAARYKPANAARPDYAPFAPLLSQGWALLSPGDPMFRPIHQELRPHLVPSLWTTLAQEGAELATRFLRAGPSL